MAIIASSCLLHQIGWNPECLPKGRGSGEDIDLLVVITLTQKAVESRYLLRQETEQVTLGSKESEFVKQKCLFLATGASDLKETGINSRFGSLRNVLVIEGSYATRMVDFADVTLVQQKVAGLEKINTPVASLTTKDDILLCSKNSELESFD